MSRRSVIQLTSAAVALPLIPSDSNSVENRRMSFTPKFVDLVRNYTMTTGTGNFVLGATVNGYSSFTSALRTGDQFYYSALGIDKPLEREVGRGMLQADGTISRDPISGVTTNFSAGIKSLSLIAAAEWFNTMQAGGGSGSGGAQTSADTRSALASLAQRQAPVVLAEPGREGLFVFDGSNVSEKVAADPYQGICVAPSSDPSGASGAWVRRFRGPVCLEWFGLADGAANNAARVESAMSLIDPSRGNWLLFPYGTIMMDGTVHVTKPCRIEGHGMGSASSGGNAGSGSTLLLFPAGKIGFQVKHGSGGGAQQTQISNLRIAASGINSASGVASYDPTPATTAALHTISLSSGAANFANGDVVVLPGANCQLTVPDRLFTTTAGSNVITFTSKDGKYRGNAVGYVGQAIDVLGAGFPAGTTITAWSSNSITVSGNAANSVTTQYCYLYGPLVAQVVSGGGTNTLTIDSCGNNPRKVTNAVLRHAEPGVYATVQHHMTNVEVMGFLAGAILHGNSESGDLADNCLYTNCTFNSGRDVTAPAGFGVITEGYDAQANSFVSCNFAGNSCGFLDMGFLGHDFYGCHWAFNNAVQVFNSGAQTKIIGGYLETGTSYLATAGGTASFFGTVSMVPGEGFSGIQPSGGVTTIGNLEALGGAKLAGAIIGNGSYQTIEAPGSSSVPGFMLPANNVTKQWTGSAHWWFTSNPSNVPSAAGRSPARALAQCRRNRAHQRDRFRSLRRQELFGERHPGGRNEDHRMDRGDRNGIARSLRGGTGRGRIRSLCPVGAPGGPGQNRGNGGAGGRLRYRPSRARADRKLKMSIAASAIGDTAIASQPGAIGSKKGTSRAPANRLVVAKNDIVAPPEPR